LLPPHASIERWESGILVHDDGAEILFAATRELLIQLTSRSLHGEFVLPGVRFADVKPTVEQRASRGASSELGAILAIVSDVPPVPGDEK
jgi:hypothetical protein